MKIIPIDINCLDKHTAIACTENYYLMLAKHLGLPVDCLFFNNHLLFHAVITDYVEKQLPYLSYDKYYRVVDAGNRLGILNHSQLGMNFEEMLDCAQEQNELGMPIFISVDALKLPRAGALPWIDKHFVILNGMENNQYSIIDDYPRRSFFLKIEELKEIYKGEIYKLQIGKMIDKAQYMRYVIDKLREIVELDIQKEFKEVFLKYSTEENTLFLRDGIAFVRVSRKQLYHWLSYIQETYNKNTKTLREKLFNQYELLNRMYLFFEVFRSRNMVDKSMLTGVFDEVYKLEYDIIEGFRELLKLFEEG